MFKISLSFIALLGCVRIIAGEPIQHAQELKRAACNSDNVLRALQHAGTTASSFCSSYIGIPVKTVYTNVPGVTPVMYSLATSSQRSEKIFHLNYSLTSTSDLP